MSIGATTRSDRVARRSARKARGLDALAAHGCAALLARQDARHGAVELWNGERISLPGATPAATVRFRTRAALARCLADPEVQLPECYAAGSIDIDGDIAAFLEASLRSANERATATSRLSYAISRVIRRISDRRARDVFHHYDLSNEFYALWLDESMTYTCAYFPDSTATLEEAQRAKLDRVCRKLGLEAGQHVIEAGSGWGSLALHMARNYGVTVTAYNLSRQQVELSRARALREGLADRVRFIEDDYRNVTGRCDAFVSVGMLEHVERSAYPELGRIVRRVLSPEGVALVHTIGRHRHLPPPRWTTRRIFPGGYMPTLAEITAMFEPNDLCVLDVENLRLHYAKTLEHWFERFESVSDRVEALFDERFVRMWRFYLASALAGFRSGWLQLFQVVFSGRANDRIPWTRRY